MKIFWGCTKLRGNIKKRNFGIGVLKQFGTTGRVQIFSAQNPSTLLQLSCESPFTGIAVKGPIHGIPSPQEEYCNGFRLEGRGSHSPRHPIHCPKCNPNFRDITRNVEENEMLRKIFHVVISFSPLNFVLNLGKSITFGTVHVQAGNGGGGAKKRSQ